MGCDIHLFTERKRNINNETKWVNIDHFKLNHYYEENNNEGESKFDFVSIYDSRDYSLFSMIANVRNRSDNNFICEPKGLPNNCSDIIKKEYKRWDGDGHSHSYFTLKELKDFSSKNKTTKYSGMMTVEDAEIVDNGEMPDSWCLSTSNKSYVYRQWKMKDETLKELIDAIELRKKEEFWIWDNEERPEFDSEIRIVFWFDN